jgi:hypothetical protein
LKTLIVWLLGFLPYVTIRGENGVPYMTRYYLLGGPRYDSKRRWNLFIHCFHTSDQRVPHNHPWSWAYSLIFWGWYCEWRNGKAKVFRPGDINSLKADTFHYVHLLTPSVWTLFLAGPRIQDWGFLDNGEVIPHREWVEKNLPGGTCSDDNLRTR